MLRGLEHGCCDRQQQLTSAEKELIRVAADGTERFSSGDFAGLKDVDGFGELSGAPGAAAEFAEDLPGQG